MVSPDVMWSDNHAYVIHVCIDANIGGPGVNYTESGVQFIGLCYGQFKAEAQEVKTTMGQI